VEDDLDPETRARLGGELIQSVLAAIGPEPDGFNLRRDPISPRRADEMATVIGMAARPRELHLTETQDQPRGARARLVAKLKVK